MTSLAVFADSHLPNSDQTVKDRVFDWALAQVQARKPDLLIAAGDLTAMGTRDAATRARRKLDAAGIPLLIIPGNAEYRTPPATDAVLRTLQTADSFQLPDVTVLGLDNSQGALSAASRALLSRPLPGASRNVMIVLHLPPDEMDAADRHLIRQLSAPGRVIGWISGHSHRDRTLPWGGGLSHETRGLDPDKAIGGPPAFMLLSHDTANNTWRRDDIAYPDGDPACWSCADKDEFRALLGISCMGDTPGGLALAADQGISCVEIRYEPSQAVAPKKLSADIEHWRKQGGSYLSLHFPDLRWEAHRQEITGLPQLESACSLAADIGVNAVSWHVPRLRLGDMEDQAAIRSGLLESALRIVDRLRRIGCRIGIENLHMTSQETAGRTRGFGYTPAECRDWIEALKRMSGYEPIGFLLDVGHARNNAPYSNDINLSQWYADMGDLICGYHLHQVERDSPGGLHNHRPILNAYGPLISFSSFFMAWQTGQIRRAPLFLEIRDHSCQSSLNYLRALFQTDKPEEPTPFNRAGTTETVD